MSGIPEAFVYDAVRTPRGRGKANGSLAEVKPIDLIVGLIDALLDRNPGLDPHRIEDLVLGCVSAVGDQGFDIAKTAAIAAGLPDTVAGVQLSRFCASGLDSVNQAAARVRAGFEHLIVAGGVESMSRVPMGSDGGAWANDPATALATSFVPQGVSADLIATVNGYSRNDVDAYAVQSQQRAAAAWDQRRFADSMISVRDRNGLLILARDEHVRAGATLESLGQLPPSFLRPGRDAGFDAVALETYHWLDGIDHVHHAGNSSGLVDGAALVLVGSEQAGLDLDLTPRARIVSYALSGADPIIMLTAPAPASRRALDRAGLRADQMDLVEVNEAFAAVAMHFRDEMGYHDDILNVNGGAIAMGHPLGATGAMLLITILDELARRGSRYGLVTLCAGGGMGIATIVERL